MTSTPSPKPFTSSASRALRWPISTLRTPALPFSTTNTLQSWPRRNSALAGTRRCLGSVLTNVDNLAAAQRNYPVRDSRDGDIVRDHRCGRSHLTVDPCQHSSVTTATFSKAVSRDQVVELEDKANVFAAETPNSASFALARMCTVSARYYPEC